MPPFVIAHLSKHLAARGRPEPDEYVFVMPGGGPLLRTTFRSRVWDPAVSRADLDGLTFHHLRHSAVGLLTGVGAHSKGISDRLGHSSVRTTVDVYGHVLPATDDEVTSTLEDAFSAGRGLHAASDQPGSAI